MKVSVIELESFNDMVLFLYSRLTTMSLNASLLCNDKNCFTIIPASEELMFVIVAPPPNQRCRYVYLDDSGKAMCSEIPLPGRPMIFILNVKNIRETGSIAEALASSSK